MQASNRRDGQEVDIRDKGEAGSGVVCLSSCQPVADSAAPCGFNSGKWAESGREKIGKVRRFCPLDGKGQGITSIAASLGMSRASDHHHNSYGIGTD